MGGPGGHFKDRGGSFSRFGWIGGGLGYPVGSKSDPGERLSRVGGPRDAKSKPKGVRNGALGVILADLLRKRVFKKNICFT